MYGWHRDREEQRERWHQAAGRVSRDQRNRDGWLRDARRRRGLDPDSGRRPPRTTAMTPHPSHLERDVPLDYQQAIGIEDYEFSDEDNAPQPGSRMDRRKDVKSMYDSPKGASIYEDDNDEEKGERSQLTARARSVRKAIDSELSPKTIRPSHRPPHRRSPYESDHGSESEITPPPSYHLIEPRHSSRHRTSTVAGSQASSPARPPQSHVSEAASSRASAPASNARSDFRFDERDAGGDDGMLSPPRYGMQRRVASLATWASRQRADDERRCHVPSPPPPRSRARSVRDEGWLRVSENRGEPGSGRRRSPSVGARRRTGNSPGRNEGRSSGDAGERRASTRLRRGDKDRNNDV